MSLAAVLSAMREIILDAPNIPQEFDERYNFYKKSFPLLSEDELRDLSKISPEKFTIYTTSIFVGEKGIISNNFPMTVKVMEQFWPAESNSKFSLLRLVKDLHKVKPWRSTASTVLGRNFVDYIRENFAAIHSAAPYLNELAEMEQIIRKVRRLPDGIDAEHRESLAELSKLSVEQVMQSCYAVPSCAQFCEFNFDLVTARSAFLADNMKSLPEVAAAPTSAVLSRNQDGHPRWVILDKRVSEYLQGLERDNPMPIEKLAETIVAVLDQTLDEEALFVSFFKKYSELLLAGVVVALPQAKLIHGSLNIKEGALAIKMQESESVSDYHPPQP